MWSSVAPAWSAHAAYIDDRARPVTDAMLHAAAFGRGDHVLELGCGPGGLGIAVAARMGDTIGELTMSDVAPEMVDIAASRVADAGLGNVHTRVLDLDAIDLPDASYDVVLCREALMFAVSPEGAAAEFARVLRPGGRAVAAVWDAQGRNPWLGTLFDAVTAATGMPVPPPGVPGPFTLGDAARVRAMFDAAGFEPVTVDEVEAPARAVSLDAWWATVTSLAGPLANVLAALPTETSDAIRADVAGALERYRTPNGIEVPGVSLLVTAVKPRG